MQTISNATAPMTPQELDKLAATSIVDTLAPETLAQALASPPFILLPSSKTATTASSSGSKSDTDDSAQPQHKQTPIACLNLRDAATEERTPELRKGRIYRAGKSAFVPSQLAERLNIVKVYDLRTERECLQDGHDHDASKAAGVEVIWHAPTSSLMQQIRGHQEANSGPAAAAALTAEEQRKIAQVKNAHAQMQAAEKGQVSNEKAAQNILVDSYMAVLESHRDVLRHILLDVEQLDDQGKQAILLHCTAGKDRTGVAVAMLLTLAGCKPEGIAADYALTRIGIEPARERLTKVMQAAVPDFDMLDPRFRALSESRPEDMLEFLDRVNQTFEGGFVGYAMQHLGITQEQIQAVRAKLRAV